MQLGSSIRRAAIAALWLAAGEGAWATTADVLQRACPRDPLVPEEALKRLPTCRAFIAGMESAAPSRADALAALAFLQRTVNDRQNALESLDQALRLDPDHLDAGLQRVELLVGLRRWDEVRPGLQRLVERYPEDPKVLRQYASYLAVSGALDDAVAAYGRAIARSEDPILRRERAGLLKRLGRMADAMADLDAVLAQAPSDGWALFERAELRLFAGQPKDALADLAAARANGQVDGIDNLLMAQAQMMLGGYSQAVEAIDAAVLHPMFRRARPELLLLRYAALRELDRPEEAERTLQRMQSEFGPPHVLRLQVFLRNRGFDVAITGQLDEATLRLLLQCLRTSVCGGGLMPAI